VASNIIIVPMINLKKLSAILDFPIHIVRVSGWNIQSIAYSQGIFYEQQRYPQANTRAIPNNPEKRH
jgi:hypothetical protein